MRTETVTIELETYNSMKREIAELKEQVKQKTIIQRDLHPFCWVLILIIMVLWYWAVLSHI